MKDLAQKCRYSNKCHRLHSPCKSNCAINNACHTGSQTVGQGALACGLGKTSWSKGADSPGFKLTKDIKTQLK